MKNNTTNSKNLLVRATFGITLFIALSACAKPNVPAAQLATTAVSNLGCKTSQSEMWNTLHRIAEDGGAYPAAADLRAALLDAGASKQLNGPAFEIYVDAFVNVYQTAVDGIKAKLNPTDLASWKKALAELEVGVRVTDVHAQLQDQLQAAFNKLDQGDAALKQQCGQDEGTISVPTSSPPTANGDHVAVNNPVITPQVAVESGTVWEQLLRDQTPEIYGARRTLATAYQSCDVLSLPAMTLATPSLSGITILPEKHPGGGLKRVYGSIAQIDASHYYIKNQRLAKSSCFEVRNSPLIYDFGGKPGTSSSKPLVLDLFRSAGTGTAVLGIDCSAFVFSALAVAGLKMDPDPKKPLKADLVHGIGSRAFKEPQSNGLRCLAKISVSKEHSITSGDIAAINGHVVMLDSVGADPFGIDRITKASDCTASKLTYANYDFVIAQSSPSKNGIGINRYRAKDYLSESASYRGGLSHYAVAACRAKFGLSATVDTTDLSVVRHKKTPECKAPALQENKSDCVDSCRAI